MASRRRSSPKDFGPPAVQGADRKPSAFQAPDHGPPANPRSDSWAGGEEDRRPAEIQSVPKRRAYRAGSFRVPVDDPAMMQGDRGELGRRFKKHLRGVASRTPMSDPDETVSVARQVGPQAPRGLMTRGPKILAPDNDGDD